MAAIQKGHWRQMEEMDLGMNEVSALNILGKNTKFS